MSPFFEKKFLIVGMGLSGKSAAAFLLAQGAIVYGSDRNSQLFETDPELLLFKKKGVFLCSENDCKDVSFFDGVILSPGIPSSHALIEAAKKARIPVMGEIELGCREIKNPVIGITGTNGKTTVTLLIEHILNHSGTKACALGNVGKPFTEGLLGLSNETAIILELSSYQLETLSAPSLTAGIILNISPDHLDRYHTMDAYARAKCGIERALKAQAPLWMEEAAQDLFGGLLKKIKPFTYGYSPSSRIYSDLSFVYRSGKKVFELPEHLKHKKSHDLENMLGAYALCDHFGVSSDHFIEGFNSFKKPSHRIEFVVEKKGVRYFDDSKGTNVDAVIRAVQSLEGPIVLIAGGVDKGSSYTPWIEIFTNKVKLICAIGQAAGKMHAQLSKAFPVLILNSLEDAVKEAAKCAQIGDNVLLSPGCSSYDMYKDYIQRGNHFQHVVRNLSL